jgi:2-keto-3-deoxy-L-rhamnonate aldolase RhmA
VDPYVPTVTAALRELEGDMVKDDDPDARQAIEDAIQKIRNSGRAAGSSTDQDSKDEINSP